jgi:hypothetical protein
MVSAAATGSWLLAPGNWLPASCCWQSQRQAGSGQLLFHKQWHHFKLIHIDQPDIGQL